MDPELHARYQTHLWQSAIWTAGFLLLTYAPLQIAALLRAKSWERIVAGLPLIVMTPLIIVGANPNTHRDGSLYGLYFFCPYIPVMLYLMAVCGVLYDFRRKASCPHCGFLEPVRSFQLRRVTGPCAKCGKLQDDPVLPPTSEGTS